MTKRPIYDRTIDGLPGLRMKARSSSMSISPTATLAVINRLCFDISTTDVVNLLFAATNFDNPRTSTPPTLKYNPKAPRTTADFFYLYLAQPDKLQRHGRVIIPHKTNQTNRIFDGQ